MAVSLFFSTFLLFLLCFTTFFLFFKNLMGVQPQYTPFGSAYVTNRPAGPWLKVTTD